MMAENVIGSVGVWFVPGGSGASEDGRWMEGSGFEEIRAEPRRLGGAGP